MPGMSTLITIGGHVVDRLAFGTAHLPQPEAWSLAPDLPRGRRLLAAAIDAGYRHIDTADTLGPVWAESIVGDVVGNREDVLVATKVGMLRTSATAWGILGHPGYLRQAVFASATRLKREPIDLVYLHQVDPDYPLADQLGALIDLKQQGLIRHIGLSQPKLVHFEEALTLTPLAAVQHKYNLADPGNRPLAEAAVARGIPFVAFWALLGSRFPAEGRDELARVIDDWIPSAGIDPYFAALDPGSRLRQLLAAWVLADQPRAGILIGSSDAGHLREFRQVLHHPLGADQAGSLARAVAAAL
jgi:aryl-alcohol dehydrogenase-like predicted oxidoreductase